MDKTEYEANQVWSVPNQNALGGMTAVMQGMDNILMFPCRSELHSSSSLTDKQQKLQEPVQICMIQRKSWINGRFQRKLMNESLDTFLSLQKAASYPEKDLKSILVRKSKEYRSIIQACISEMTKYIEDSEKGKSLPFVEDTSELKEDCQLLYKLELLLGLAEIVFVNALPGGVVLPQLLTWVRLHYPLCRQRLSEALTHDQPHLYAQYWETIYGLVLQGLLDEARDLLSRHPDSNFDSYLSMDELLRKMPLYKVYSGISEAEFMARWHHWQSECQARLQKGEFVTNRQLEIICKIICGDSPTLVSLCDVADTWSALMASSLLYSNPVAKLHRLPAAAQEALLAYGADDPPEAPLDRILLAIFESNDHLVLKECQSVIGNIWFSAHLCDLLCHAAGNQADKMYLREMRENLLIDYGCQLATHRSLWQLGLVYLDSSGPGPSGPYAEVILQRIPLGTDHKALKVTQAAADRNLGHVAMGVCRVMGRRRLREGQLASALWWGVRSQDAAFTSHLAHKILHKYVEEGQFTSTSLLDHLGPAITLSDTLTFLSKYREFHSLYQEGRMEDAADLLVSLIASRLAPEYFWPVLLEDALPLLQTEVPVISAEQTYKLMYCLHNVTITADDNKTEKERKRRLYVSFFDKESEVRQALTNNLARAIIQEGTVERGF